MRDLLKPIQNNLDALRFSVEFDIYDLTKDQQEAILNRLDEIESIVNKVKSESR